MELIDLSHTLSPGTPVYPGDPKVEFEPVAQIGSRGFSVTGLRMGMHAGTHIDAPAHMIQGGALLSDFPIERFFGRGRFVDARGVDSVGPELLENMDIGPGDFILVWTGWGKKFGQEAFFEGYPVLSEKFAARAVELGVALVGLDTPGPDKPPFKVHKLLFENNILIAENLANMEKLQGKPNLRVFALPSSFKAEAAPARVVVEA